MDFAEKIYAVVKKIPKGSTLSYSAVAELAGHPRASRAVANALHQNPMPGLIPCHRVIKADGTVASNFAFGGPGEQARLLKREGAKFRTT